AKDVADQQTSGRPGKTAEASAKSVSTRTKAIGAAVAAVGVVVGLAIGDVGPFGVFHKNSSNSATKIPDGSYAGTLQLQTDAIDSTCHADDLGGPTSHVDLTIAAVSVLLLNHGIGHANAYFETDDRTMTAAPGKLTGAAYFYSFDFTITRDGK